MAKKPHIDFKSRTTLDGTEELYSQSAEWEDSEQKFTLTQVSEYILDQISNEVSLGDLKDINSPTSPDVILNWNGTNYDWIPTPTGGSGSSASNGLTQNTDYELGGTLTKNTTIDTAANEFTLTKQTVGLQAYNQNPVWTPGDESFFLTGKNLTRDTENFMGVTDHSSTGGIIQMYTRKPVDGTNTFFFQVPTQTTIQSEKKPENDRTTLQLSYYGMFLTAFEGGDVNEGGFLSVDKQWSEFRRLHSGSEVNLRYQKKSTSSNNLEVLFKGLPVYNDIAAAQADNYPSEGLFKTPGGVLLITP